MPGTYQQFFAALRQRESSNDYTAVNSVGFIGAYQFGEAALFDLGYVRRDKNFYDNNYSGGWTGKWHWPGWRSSNMAQMGQRTSSSILVEAARSS